MESILRTPRSQMKQFEEELLKDDWTRVKPEVEVKKIAIRDVSSRGAIIVPTKDRIEWPYVALLIGIVLMIVAAASSVVGLGRLCDLRRFVGVCDVVQNPPMISMTREVQ